MAQAEGAAPPPAWLGGAPFMFLLLWSLGFPVAKIAIADVEPITLLALRYGLVLAVLGGLFIVTRPPLPSRGREWLHLAVVGFLIQAVYFGLCYVAFSIGTSAGTVALVVSLQPVIVALLAPFLVGERIRPLGWLGFALGFGGAVMVIAARSGIEATHASGLLCAVGALLGMSGATLYEKRFGVQQHPVLANLVQNGVGMVVVLPFAFAFETMQITWTSSLIAALSYLVIGNSLIAITLLLAMIRFGAAARVSALFFLVPPMAALLAWVMLGEVMPGLAWVGMGISAIGIALVGSGASALSYLRARLRKADPAKMGSRG